MSRVVVIGGGVVGLCSAYFLARDGHSVTVVDRNGFRDSASWGNAGMIVPSHFEPLATPGMLALGLKMMFQPGAPLGFQGVGFGLAEWMWKFYRAATPEHAHRASPIIRDLNLFSKSCFSEISGVVPDATGLLMVCRTERTLQGELQVGELAKELGLRTRDVSPAELEKDGYRGAGGVLFEDDAHIVSADFMAAMPARLATLGVVTRPGNIDGFEAEDGRVKAVTLDGGERIPGDQFVLAAGAWGGKLAGKLGTNMPMMPGRGYGFNTMESFGNRTMPSAILVEARVATSPTATGRRFTGGMEIGAWGNSVTTSKVEAIKRSIPDYLPSYEGHSFGEEIWVGHRPCSPDGMPYLGRLSSAPNVIAATGHGMMGMSLGPGTGRIVAHLANYETPLVSIALCRPDRF